MSLSIAHRKNLQSKSNSESIRPLPDEVRSFVELSLNAPLSALPQLVQEATRKLFAAFDG
jgi:hypothetical protein